MGRDEKRPGRYGLMKVDVRGPKDRSPQTPRWPPSIGEIRARIARETLDERRQTSRIPVSGSRSLKEVARAALKARKSSGKKNL